MAIFGFSRVPPEVPNGVSDPGELNPPPEPVPSNPLPEPVPSNPPPEPKSPPGALIPPILSPFVPGDVSIKSPKMIQKNYTIFVKEDFPRFIPFSSKVYVTPS